LCRARQSDEIAYNARGSGAVLNPFRLKRPIRTRTAQVGWILDADKASVIWDAPRKILRDEPEPAARHAKSVRYCPAVIEHEARYFEIPCAIDFSIRIRLDEKTKEPLLINSAGDLSTIRQQQFKQLIVLVGRKEWRHPKRPIIQIRTPSLFVADEPVYMTQLPPFAHYAKEPWPGIEIGGRFPIHIWPRHLMWAFEWYDCSKDLVLRRGDPWFYVRFETEDPSRPVKLVEAEMTEPLRQYLNSVSTVTNYVSRTFSLFETARQRRPKTLLLPKQR
jgi:hypothetical protein